MFNSLFKIVYFIEVLIAIVVRKIYTRKYIKLAVKTDRKTKTDILFLALNGIGMIIPIVYVFSSIFDFADYSAPKLIGWIGAVIFSFAICLLWRSHADLGKHFTYTLGIREDHQLITNGVFKYIRHPMYASHVCWAIAQIMLLHNWIAGYSFIVVLVPHTIFRVKSEEIMMIEQFGEIYKEYMKNTGRIMPRIGVKK